MRRIRKRLATTTLFMILAACTTTPGSTSSDESATVNLLHDRGLAARAVAAIEGAVGASPARVGEVLAYPEYLDHEAQVSKVPDHINRYEWRDGGIPPATPVQLSGPQEGGRGGAVPDVGRAVEACPSRSTPRARRAAHTPLCIEAPQAQHVIVERSTSPADDGRVLVRIDINGPRRSGSVEMTASGAVRTVEVN